MLVFFQITSRLVDRFMPNKCNDCDYASCRANDLKTNLKMHIGEKSNNCSQCKFAWCYIRLGPHFWFYVACTILHCMSKSRYSSSSLFLVEWLVRIRSMLFSSYPSSFSMLSSLSLLSSSTYSSFTSRHSCRRHRRRPPPQPPCCWCCGWSDSEVLVHEHVQVHAQVNKKRKKLFILTGLNCF